MNTKSILLVLFSSLYPLLMGAECGPAPVDTLCRFDIDCINGQICNPAQQVCVDAPSQTDCTLAAGCPYGQYCQLKSENIDNVNDGTCVSAQSLADNARRTVQRTTAGSSHPAPTNPQVIVKQELFYENGSLSGYYSQINVEVRWGEDNLYGVRVPHLCTGAPLLDDLVGVVPENTVPNTSIWPGSPNYMFELINATGPSGMNLTNLKNSVQNALGFAPSFEGEYCDAGPTCTVFVKTPMLSEIDYALKINASNPALAATLDGFMRAVHPGSYVVNDRVIARY